MHSTSQSRCAPLIGMALAFRLLLASSTLAAPSGGPYGPVQKKYEVPKDAAHVYYVAPDGKSEAEGGSIKEPTTLEAALEKVVTGDAVIFRGGTYRTGGLKFNQQITIQPYQDERPILKGTQVADKWENLRNGLWRIKWSPLFPSAPQDWWNRQFEMTRTPLVKFNNDMVFVDGKPLDVVSWPGEVKENSFWVDYEKSYIYIGVNPANKLVEITAFDSALTRTISEVHGKKSDGKGATIRGVTFTQYAYRALEIEGKDPEAVSPEAEHGNDVVGSIFEDCTISHCTRVAGYFRGNHLVIRHCLVSNTGTEGIFVIGANDILLEGNIVMRNNVRNITGYFASAVKIWNQCYRATCRDNLIIDNPNGSCGVWYDVGEVDGMFVNNWVERTDNGFFYEISKGATCAGNVFVDCGTGIKILNSRDVHVYQNTMVNSALWIERTPRNAVGDHFDWHPASGPDVDQREGHVAAGNLMVGRADFRLPLLVVGQTAALRDRLTKPQLAELDYNVYVRRTKPYGDISPIYKVPTDYQTTEQLHAAEFDAHSKTLDDYYGPLFKGEQLGRFKLLPEFSSATSSAPLPHEVAELLGYPEDRSTFPGAFPPTN